jgi:tetratricopeptide (TPR) repeat protein
MARRRLNKKVALVGSTVFLLLALGAVVVILKVSGDPAQFTAEGDVAYAARDYEAARRHYLRAFSLSESSQERVDLLFKLADVYRDTNKWRHVQRCWHEIITADSTNVEARMARLKYRYVLADSLAGAGQAVSAYWEDVHDDASELIELARSRDLMDTPKADLEPSFGSAEPSDWDGGIAGVGPYLHFVKGRAAYEIARLGHASTAPDALLDEALQALSRAKQLDPNSATVYRYLSEVYWTRGEEAASRDDLEARDAAAHQAEAMLVEGTEAVGDRPEPHLNLLGYKLARARQGDIAPARKQMAALEPEYRMLAERFPESSGVFGDLAEYYSYCAVYAHANAAAPKLARAIEAAEKARALDPESVRYARYAALLYYRQYSLYQANGALDKAITVAEQALELPDAKDVAGPRQFATQGNRVGLCSFLARCYVERVMTQEATAAERDELVRRAGEVVHEIEQIRGSGENPQVVMWRGMLDLAEGRTNAAICNLYAAYEQIKASSPGGEADAYLAYRLAKIFEETTEVGAVLEFLGSALQAGIIETRPDALLDYAEAALRARSYDVALRAVTMYDDQFGGNSRSRVLRIEALIEQGNIPEAEGQVAALPSDDPNGVALQLKLARAKAAQLRSAIRRAETANEAPTTMRPAAADPEASRDSLEAMAAELRAQYRQEADLLQKHLRVRDGHIEDGQWVPLCEALMRQGDIDSARRLVDALDQRTAGDATVLFYRQLLRTSDPAALSADRRREIRARAVASLADPVQRALEMGTLYQAEGRIDDAVAQWQQVLDGASADTNDEPAYLRAKRLSPRHVAASQLFDVARHRQQWDLAADVVTRVKKDNLDDCNGHLFSARLAYAREQYHEALEHLDECLRRRPIFSYGYLLRGNVQVALGNQHAAVEDLTKAAELNPADPVVARGLAQALYKRNQILGENVTSQQRLQTRRALERAVELNPRETNLLQIYADYIAADEPLRALALRQTIQIHAPTVHNAVRLGQLATRMAVETTDEQKQGAYFLTAAWAFEQARQIDPNDRRMLESYAEYYRVRRQNDKAQQLLAGSQDSRLLWRHYVQIGRYDEARNVLEEIYTQQQNRVDALKGLALVAQRTVDREGVRKYTRELLTLEDNETNRLAQIQAFLDVGLVKDAELKLQSFREKFPEHPRILWLEALLAMRQGQLDRAWALANRSLERQGQSASVWRLRGQIARLRGDSEQAIRDFRRSRQLEENAVTAMYLAEAYVWAGRPQEAVETLEEIVERPDAPDEAGQLLESIYRRLGRTTALEKLHADRLARQPDNVAWLVRAGAFAIEQRDFARGEVLYEKAYRLERGDSAALESGQTGRDARHAAALDGYLRALVLAAGDPNAGAGQWRPQKLDKVLALGREYADTAYAPVAFYRMAEAKKQLGDRNAAAEYCRKAMDSSWSNERTAMEVLLRIYLLMGPEEVSKYCHERLGTDPDSVAANYTMFNLAKLEGDWDEAARYIDVCLRLTDPQTPRYVRYVIKKAEVLTLAWKRTSDNGYLDRAIAVYESLRAEMPKNSSVLNNLAYMLAQGDGKLAEALEYAEQAVEISPDEANYLDTYGYVLYRSGKPDKAVEVLAAAIQQYEVDGQPSGDVYEHMGLAREAMGEDDKAVAAYRRALEVGGGAMADEARDRLTSAIERLAR